MWGRAAPAASSGRGGVGSPLRKGPTELGLEEQRCLPSLKVWGRSRLMTASIGSLAWLVAPSKASQSWPMWRCYLASIDPLLHMHPPELPSARPAEGSRTRAWTPRAAPTTKRCTASAPR